MSLENDAFIGFAIGDAVGVPFIGKGRYEMEEDPATGLRGIKHTPMEKKAFGEWSDNTALMIATADALSLYGYNLKEIALCYIEWYLYGKYTPGMKKSGGGDTTIRAIKKILNGESPYTTGAESFTNGCLSRVLPLAFYLLDQNNITNRQSIVYSVANITHSGNCCKIACHIYVEFARQLIKGKTVKQAYDFIVKSLWSYYADVVRMEDLLPYDKRITGAYPYFQEIFDGSLKNIKKEDLVSSADVVCSIKTALWCLMNTSSYSEAVLTAVNLGEDTDSIGAIVGGLAGIVYGKDEMPDEWVSGMTDMSSIVDIAERMKHSPDFSNAKVHRGISDIENVQMNTF